MTTRATCPAGAWITCAIRVATRLHGESGRPDLRVTSCCEKPEQAPPLEHETLLHSRFKRTIERNLATNETLYHIFSDGDEFEGASLARLKAINLELGTAMDRRFVIEETNPLSASFEIRQSTLFRRRRWSVRIETRARMTSTKDDFRIVAELKASEGNELVFSRQWDRKIPRKLL